MTALERARELVAEPKWTDAGTLNEVDSERVLAIAAAGLGMREALWSLNSGPNYLAWAEVVAEFDAAIDAALGGGA